MAAKHECSQSDRILTLELKYPQMSKDIQETKDTCRDIQSTMLQMKETLDSFILTAPQKFADKNEMDRFKDSLNIKIATISGGCTVIMFIIGVIVNYYTNKG